MHSPQEEYEPLDVGSLQRPEQARDVARGFMAVAAAEGGTSVDAVLLVVPELFTNAVRHADGVTGFRMEAGLGTVTVEVDDASTVPPRALPLDAARPGGFGWHVVQELSVDVWVDVHAVPPASLRKAEQQARTLNPARPIQCGVRWWYDACTVSAVPVRTPGVGPVPRVCRVLLVVKAYPGAGRREEVQAGSPAPAVQDHWADPFGLITKPNRGSGGAGRPGVRRAAR
ncbi:ATP-binding protein [Streptomyces sp. NPDC006132]|uniref:ATP-binding protein n=1 Tax=Streptomyces sp. NPDC006132 TaxID=3156732 RepID=UPI0033E58B13